MKLSDQWWLKKLKVTYISGEFPDLGYGSCCVDTRPCQVLWKLRGVAEHTVDSGSTTNLPVVKSAFLNLWALVSASKKWDPSSYVPSKHSEGNDLQHPQMTVPFFPHQILLPPTTLDWCSYLLLYSHFMSGIFGTFHSWPSFWSVYCLVKAFVKSPGLFNWRLILLAMISLIMALARQPCWDLAEPQQLYC